MMYVLLGLVLFGWVCIFYRAWYRSTDHWHNDNGLEAVDENATIVDVQEEIIGSGSDRKWRTTVCFEDGFRYVSHKSHSKNFIVFVHLKMTDELREEILNDAKEAHRIQASFVNGTYQK